MSKAVEEMYRNTDQKSFQDRYITSATLTVSPEQVEILRLRLQEMIIEIVDLADTKPSQNLYGLSFSFFPLIKMD
jgi:hypothetical protein